MSRRTLRSAGAGFRSSGRALAIPNNLPVNGTIEVISAKRIKREHENDAYVRVRSLRTGQQIVIAELRDEWQKLLLPSASSMHVEDGQGAALAAEAEMPDRPPLYIGACYGSEAVQQQLETELVAVVAKADWREMWVLLGQIATCIERLASPDAVRPWWARTGGSDNEVIEHVDLVARESVGAVDAPIDVEDTDASTGVVAKEEEASPPMPTDAAVVSLFASEGMVYTSVLNDTGQYGGCVAMLGCTLTARGDNLVELNDKEDWLGSGTWRLTAQAVGRWKVDAAGGTLIPVLPEGSYEVTLVECTAGRIAENQKEALEDIEEFGYPGMSVRGKYSLENSSCEVQEAEVQVEVGDLLLEYDGGGNRGEDFGIVLFRPLRDTPPRDTQGYDLEDFRDGHFSESESEGKDDKHGAEHISDI